MQLGKKNCLNLRSSLPLQRQPPLQYPSLKILIRQSGVTTAAKISPAFDQSQMQLSPRPPRTSPYTLTPAESTTT
ncbi:MAG: hypothetical protein KME55_35325 [Nostoc indistinguendum CM1-VF10]|nr:hypothetical protein [Nostoc indistinguendum CM1-VF10]